MVIHSKKANFHLGDILHGSNLLTNETLKMNCLVCRESVQLDINNIDIFSQMTASEHKQCSKGTFSVPFIFLSVKLIGCRVPTYF